MVLIDTSAWVEFFRKTLSPVNLDIRSRLNRGEELAVTDPVIMELYAGAPTRQHLEDMQAFIAGCELMPVFGLSDYESAASIYRQCRAGGGTPRNHLDCLIAAVAIREDIPLLHNDRDFDLIAEHTSLKIA